MWLLDIHADEIRALETNLLLCEGADDPDPDHVDACVDYMRARHAEAREEALRFVRDMFDEHNVGPALISPRHMARGCLMNLGACDLEPRVFVFPV